jgi:hypothetical protein
MVFYTAASEDAVITGIHTNGYSITVPADAKYMRFSIPKKYADGSQIQIELGTMVTAYEPYRAPEAFYADEVFPKKPFYQGYFDWGRKALYHTHELKDGALVEKETPELDGMTAGPEIRPKGSTIFACHDASALEVSGRANPGALIDILTRRLDSMATMAAAAGGGAL